MTEEKRVSDFSRSLYPSWVYNEKIRKWEPPVLMPEVGVWVWDESKIEWKLFEPRKPDFTDVSFI